MRWPDQAKADLKTIHNVLARDSPHYAKEVTQELVEKTDRSPSCRGSAAPSPSSATRKCMIPAYSYRILYEIKPGDDIVVLAVIHKRRDLRPDEAS